MTEYEINGRIADKICQDPEWHGQSFREGQYVALLDGKVVAVGDTPEEAILAVRSLDADPRRGMVVEVVRHDPDEAIDFYASPIEVS